MNFVLVTQPRTGSTVIGCSLAIDHPNIEYFGEIFHPTFRVSKSEANHQTMSGWNLNLKTTIPSYYDKTSLDNYISNIFNLYKNKSLGFKLQYQDPVFNKFKLKNNIKIIHLKRDNLLDSYISAQKAIVTNRLHTNHNEELVPSFKTNKFACKKYFDETINYYKQFDEKFIGFDVLEIFYHELEVDFQKTMEKICDFIEVNHVLFHQHIVKTPLKSYSEQITNYAELKEYFLSTEYSRFFN